MNYSRDLKHQSRKSRSKEWGFGAGRSSVASCYVAITISWWRFIRFAGKTHADATRQIMQIITTRGFFTTADFSNWFLPKKLATMFQSLDVFYQVLANFRQTLITVVRSTINHSYWSFVRQLSYLLGAPHCINCGNFRKCPNFRQIFSFCAPGARPAATDAEPRLP
jgi:hypothetical protein